MKCQIPEIAYHNRDPVLSLDFQLKRKDGDPIRLATGGSDTHVVIWEVKHTEDGKVNLECLCDLKRHQRAVNIVRWSPDGGYLASGDDESVIIIWQLRPGSGEACGLFDDDTEENRENWIVFKMLRFHLDDVYDISWSPCSTYILSGAVDNTAIISDVQKNRKVGHFAESRGFVQGVAWNPKHPLLAVFSSDRSCRIYNSKTRKLVHRTYKASLGMDGGKEDRPEADKADESADKSARLFHDDTFKGFFRRLSWSNDGELLMVPTGIIESDKDAKLRHCTYVFSRCDLTKPCMILPAKDKYTIAVRFSPVLYTLRKKKRPAAASKQDSQTNQEEETPSSWQQTSTNFALDYRMVFAVATQNAVMIYDTQQSVPVCRVSNIHYAGLTDLAWSPDGKILFVASSDGFCSIITFSEGELGTPYVPPTGDLKPTESTASGMGQDEEETADTVQSSKESPAKPQLKPDDDGAKLTQTPKRLQLITLSSPKADKKLPGRFENKAKDVPAPDPMETEDSSTDLCLVLEDTQSEADLESKQSSQEEKRVPLVTLSTTNANAATTPSKSNVDGEKDGKGRRRVELITLSSPRTKAGAAQ